MRIDQVRRSRRPRRSAAYVEQYGEECWELDALSPTVIADLIRTEIEAMIDVAKWRKREAAERRNRALLDRVSRIGPRSRKQWCARIVALYHRLGPGRSPIVLQHGARMVHPQPLCGVRVRRHCSISARLPISTSSFARGGAGRSKWVLSSQSPKASE